MLEHFLTPNETLQELRELMHEKSILYVAVPDSGRPAYPIQTVHFRVVHTYYFTIKTLLAILNKNGFQIIKAKRNDVKSLGEIYCFAKLGSAKLTMPSEYYWARKFYKRKLAADNNPLILLFRSLKKQAYKIVKKVLGKK